jgi:PST family polysaccharide transporter
MSENKGEAQKVDMRELKRKSLRGGSVTMISQGISFVINLSSTILLARLLSPLEFGAIAMVTALTGFAGLFRDLGLSAAAVQKKDLTNAQQSNLFWLNLAMGLILTLVVASASPLVGMFYGRPELMLLCLVSSLNFLIGSLTTQHSASMIRNMQFGRQATAMIGGNVLGLIATILMALKGMSYWSLVWGGMLGSICTSLMMARFSPLQIVRPQRGTHIKDMLRFGANVTAFDFVNYFARNTDNILIGRYAGADALGLYTRAYRLLMFPINSIRGPINAVAFPALSKLQDEPMAFRNYYLKITSVVAWLSMPLTAFLFVSSEALIEILLGSQWRGAAPIFSYLVVAAFIQPTSGLAGSLLISLGRTKRYLQCGLFNMSLIVLSFCIGIMWGATGVAVSYAIVNYVVLYPWLRWAFKESPVSIQDFLKACYLPAATSLATATASVIILNNFETKTLLLDIVIPAAIFILLFVAIISHNKKQVKELYNYAKSAK